MDKHLICCCRIFGPFVPWSNTNFSLRLEMDGREPNQELGHGINLGNPLKETIGDGLQGSFPADWTVS